jgi:hypothetical protein
MYRPGRVDPRLTVVARVTGSEPTATYDIDFLNTTPDPIGLWEFGLLLPDGRCLMEGMAMEEVIPPGQTYTWSAPLQDLRRSLRNLGVAGFDGVMVDAYTVPDLEHFEDDLHLPLRDGPVRITDSR